ncbi:MAG: DNA polymerase-3 subunit gamma/tau [Pontimonas sp.]
MVTALYRRYRPETFAELIGQAHVTNPLGQALLGDRVNHAYLFSGPRGCGKTTSARILARCLNCATGPTDTPCGTCPSCVELSRDGGGSLDVVEIDAASHNGVDDARDLRERAVFAPARDRYKIFILDEAHMVTQQGFNALLKIVEEPPEHVKFIFATTEPDKVLGTIRSRTHHYPFRLVPPSELLAYVEQMCAKESVSVEEGVLPLVVRAGGGSVRDTLSVLDQLIAGSPEPKVTYGHAIGLLGYTHGELLAEVMTSLASGVGSATFQALDKVIQTGQDPRRFGEDLLEYVRDLIIVDQAGVDAAALLPGLSVASLTVMRSLATGLGTPALSAMADVMAEALSSMTGATSPTLHLELLMARLLVSRSTSGDTGTHAAVSPLPPPRTSTASDASAAPTPAPAVDPPSTPLTSELMIDSWPAILEGIGEKKRAVWTALVGTSVVGLENDVLTIGFPSLSSSEVLKKPQGPGLAVNAELVRDAILEISGHRVRFKVQELAPTAAPEAPPEVASAPEEVPAGSWPTVAPPRAEGEKTSNHETQTPEEPEVESPSAAGALSQVGEAVIREVLGGELVSEHPVASDEEK